MRHIGKGKSAGLKLFLWLMITTLLLSGCTSTDKSRCVHINWQKVGFEDGARGFKASRINDHRDICIKQGVVPDIHLYKNGRHQGLMTWCTPRNGYRLGLQGKISSGVCPADLEPKFSEAIDRGRALLAYEKEVEIQSASLKKAFAQMNDMDKNISDLKVEINGGRISPRRRMALLRKMRRYQNERRQFLIDIEHMQNTIADMRKNLENMRSNPPY